ncbi:MAG TPA: adenosylmethionine--8-amino-7-oxononanoate transaminase [Alphaproteobacteria bacterium]|nr:adenosylmethionine--8-amino-7-oxononanoate transaminase [Micavibrio sp.]MBK9562936.1 adenosylmethionine--8-amino-7-oxononanoate transaminase [Micavibrio sp.]HQX26716.1 adenosylmethionine--8-amino-7-oxononanoate transaminase [Alphaproteobacteria bacterium]
MSVWHPFTQHALAGPEIEIERAEGAYLYAKDGRKILDGISSWWVNTHGHCHPEIVKAVQQQASKLEQVIFAGFTHAPAEELAEKLLRVTKNNFSHVFYSDSGSTAVEVALKMAIGYWKHSGEPRKTVVALEGGYHGDTFGGMSAGGRGPFNDIYKDFLFDVVHLPFNDMEKSFEKVLKGGDVAALILEPLVLAAGGMKFYSLETLQKLSALCKKYDTLLIADEVMTGFGRTGTMFACEQANVWPDIMCLSKGLTGGFLPMGATLCTSKIYDAFYHKDRSKMFFHSSSYTGNALACAAALASLKIWEAEPVMARIASISAAHRGAVARFQKRPDVENVRSLGTILALDVIASEAKQSRQDGLLRRDAPRNDEKGYLAPIGPKLYEFFMEHNVLLRPLGNTVYILPPYCITEEELDHVYGIIDIALDHLRDGREQQAA